MLNIAEEKSNNELEDIAIEIIQNETEKKDWKRKTAEHQGAVE